MRIVCLGILLSFVLSFAQISVEVKDEQMSNQSMLGLQTRIINNSGQSYDNVVVNILLKKNNVSETYALDTYYTEGWNCSIAEQSGEYVVVKMVIPHLGAGTSPNEAGVSVGIHRTNWLPLPKSNENGYPSGIAFTTALNYSVYHGDALIGGTSYIDPSSVVPSLRFVGVQPENYSEKSVPAWIEIENYGTAPADLSNMTLEWPTNTGISSNVVSNAVLQPGKRLRVCTMQFSCPDDDVVVAIPALPMDSVGEILLRYNGVAKDYLSWGLNEGKLAADAREANIQYTKIRYDTGLPWYKAFDEYWNEIKRNNGLFYKKIDGVWFSYSSDNDVNTTNRPSPVPYSNNEMVCLEGGARSRTVRFAWHSMLYAPGYELTIKKVNGPTVFNQVISQPYQDIVLDEGLYQWKVIVLPRRDQYAVSNSWDDHYEVWKQKLVTSCSEITNEHELHVEPIGVHKDTRMLVPNWGELAEFPEISWDHPDIFMYNSKMDSVVRGGELQPQYPWNGNTLFLEVDWRCWAVGAQILNHFYGGNLTQDEIKFYGKTAGFKNVVTDYGVHSRNERDKIISAFVLGDMGGAYPAEVKNVLKWALNLTDDSQLEHKALGGRSFDQDFVMGHINAGRPIYYMQNGHIMIVDGYRFSSDRFQVHRVNVYNGGEVEWINNENYDNDDDVYRKSYISVAYYFVPMNVTNPRMTDNRVHTDSDGDGIVDFDEMERFHTNPYSIDSDGDDIGDKVEIFSYTIKEKFEKVVNVTSAFGWSYERLSRLGDYDCYYGQFSDKIYRTEEFADIDGDGNRAEKDVDSDHPNNDGLPDGMENLNHNGYVDNGETDPYDFSDDGEVVAEPKETVDWDAPSQVAIYAFEGINVGDNVTCNSGMHGYCKIASESPSQYYAVSVGTNSTFGGVFSKGGIQLRNNAHVVGDVSVYSLPTNSISPELGQGSSVTGTTDVRTVGEWPFVVSDNAQHSLENKDSWEDKTVYPGQTFVLDGDATYRNLTVQAGGTLKLGTGTIKVGNITMEWGSRLEFVNPGRETVLIVDGYVNWKTQIVNSDLQTVAKGFKLIQYAPGYIHIEGDWAGTIHARWSELTLGQVKKTAYGSFVAKKVYLGNGLTLYRVHFSPIPLTDLV